MIPYILIVLLYLAIGCFVYYIVVPNKQKDWLVVAIVIIFWPVMILAFFAGVCRAIIKG